MTKKGDQAGQLSMAFFGDMIPRGDGSYVLKPRPLAADGQTWISLKEAQRMIGGSVSRKSIARLCYSGELKDRRPTPDRIEIELESVKIYMERIKDPEYWERKAAEQRKLVRSRAETSGVRE